MELIIKSYKTPEKIDFNFEELKAELTLKAEHYASIVYSDEQIKEAKTTKANLNKLKKALNDERIRREKEYMQPFKEFKAKVDEIIAIIDNPIQVIDQQCKAFEEQRKEEKIGQIIAFWNELSKDANMPCEITLEKIFIEKWLNASVSMKSIQEEIKASREQIAKDLDVIENLPEFSFEAKEVYINTLDLAKAVNEAHRMREMAQKKAAWEEEQAKRAKPTEQAEIPCTPYGANKETTEEKSRVWISFTANLTVDDAQALRNFFNSRNIEFKPL